jgi:hypothetical protein
VIEDQVKPRHLSHLLENTQFIWQVAFFSDQGETPQDYPRLGVHFPKRIPSACRALPACAMLILQWYRLNACHFQTPNSLGQP